MNVLASKIVEIATEGEPTPPPVEKNQHAVALRRLGGQKGGKARAEQPTLLQQKEIAKKAAKARWSKKL